MFKAKVVRIIDGDTFEINKLYKGIDIVRIANFNTPEKGKAGYEAAKNKLGRLIYGKYVNIYPKAIGKFKRLVADVYINGKSVASLMK